MSADVELLKKLVDWADAVWIAEELYHLAPRIKKLKKLPIVAHLQVYPLICPHWNATYGSREICLKKLLYLENH
jgi:hypothetical protein